MGAYVLRLLEDRLEPATTGLALGPAERIFYCASGELSINEATIVSNEAHFSAEPCRIGAGAAGAHVLRFELIAAATGEEGLLHGDGATSRLKLAHEVELEGSEGHLMRCDRVDFPPGAIAQRHTHVGPGIRCLLKGHLRVETGGRSHELAPFDAWYEAGPETVLATAAEDLESAFVRGMVLPRELMGKPSVRYLNPDEQDKPKPLGRTNFLDQFITL
jgi:quercetin dioxygenase-like cupin family protein